MADTATSTPAAMSMPLINTGMGPVGYENGAQAHMPPPSVPPISIPHNTSNVMAALSALPPSSAILSPLSATALGAQQAAQQAASARRVAPEPNNRALYVGGLDPRVTEDVLKQIFETTGHVQSVKIIPDKNFQSKGYNYGFVEYDDPQCAERAMQTLNGRRVHQQEIRVNWAYQSNTTSKEDTSNHFHIFVGDLSNEVNDEVLLQAFSAFGQVSEARVMWDMKTGRSRGYGFVAFRDRSEAEKALSSMDGEWLGSRAIRCNWANQKGQPSFTQQQALVQMGMTPTTPYGHHSFPTQGAQSFEMITQQTPQWQTTVYVGNLTPYTTQNDIVPLFQNFGYVTESRFQSDRGFAFVKMDTHDNAAMAICQLSGYNINGRPLKCSWGKDRPPTGQLDGYSPALSAQPQSAYPPTPQGFFPQYAQPNPMSPQVATPAGQFGQHPSPGSWANPQMTPQTMHPPPGSWPPSGVPPPSAGGYGGPTQTPGGYGGPGQTPGGYGGPAQSLGGYGGAGQTPGGYMPHPQTPQSVPFGGGYRFQG
ncbi:E3 ubiquitin-protein ligase pub1 [Friedmanniomyces endolithicus]|uniref:E3 ubiquitin-protein ligase pub1 n=1 Tax=Friedmanniomyces endolithicus TaxID=329885 RepID=A0AAN6R0D8_9PEZI|nr:E3 ubiquitin-protein ligase pub1 [Friedmanniomyces endolithicus]KAK0785796.1 E3 ubiquitin-protein ligase pub1 [Friedmanniomyces endolithicus]KAK0914818.1 E3 ubiquitin-protein ligase pub1 [Friedmanniomyces endolithicus]KAK0925974.1 E3 ubiquitin-protein ligase pub1 [Friedmanniomyces endolithicus]KAK1004151.1 E3 ubiquitin-protein ligase pub1 [Friedmanniomyces endolithicus]